MGDEKLHLFGEYVLDRARGCLLRSGEPIHLRPQAYRALRYLAENHGRLISKDQLIEEVWDRRAVTDDSLVQCLRDVRQALGEQGTQYLRTERGRGYIFDREASTIAGGQTISDGWSEQIELLRVIVEDEESLDRVSQTAAPDTSDVRTSQPTPAGSAFKSRDAKQGSSTVILVGVIIAAAAGLIFYFKDSAKRTATINSIVVLPFVNEGDDENTEYLSDGLTEGLINSLSQFPQMKVIARTSAFKYKGREVDPLEISRSLGVQAIVTGRVKQLGDNLIVSAELVDGRDRTQIWGAQYSRAASDIQVVQHDLARTISEKLRLQLSGQEEERLAKRATPNSQAYQFYLNGLFHRQKGGIENVNKALQYFEQAIALDQNFASAWVAVAEANLYFAGNSLLNPKEPNLKAKTAVQKALELDDTLADAHVVMALIKRHEWDWAGAQQSYARAIELNPNLVDAHHQYSNYLSFMERHDEALAAIRRAQAIDPLRDGLKRAEAWVLYLAGRPDEALELRRRVDAGTSSGWYGLALIYAGAGAYEQAINEYKAVIRRDGESSGILCYLGSALALSGRRREAEAILHRLETTKDYVSPTELASLYISLGMKERTFATLEKAYAERDLQLQSLKVDWHFDSVRSDPRFQDLLRRVGLTS